MLTKAQLAVDHHIRLGGGGHYSPGLAQRLGWTAVGYGALTLTLALVWTAVVGHGGSRAVSQHCLEASLSPSAGGSVEGCAP